jgi:hypothetical protein
LLAFIQAQEEVLEGVMGEVKERGVVRRTVMVND